MDVRYAVIYLYILKWKARMEIKRYGASNPTRKRDAAPLSVKLVSWRKPCQPVSAHTCLSALQPGHLFMAFPLSPPSSSFSCFLSQWRWKTEHHGDVGRSDPAAAGSIRKEEMSRVRCCKSERSYCSCEAAECLPASVLCAVNQWGADVALTLTDERLRAASPALSLSARGPRDRPPKVCAKWKYTPLSTSRPPPVLGDVCRRL